MIEQFFITMIYSIAAALYNQVNVSEYKNTIEAADEQRFRFWLAFLMLAGMLHNLVKEPAATDTHGLLASIILGIRLMILFDAYLAKNMDGD